MEKHKLIIPLILLALVTVSLTSTTVAYDKVYDLSVVGVSPWYYQHYDEGYEKFIPGYRVLVANYGNSTSPNATMRVYIKTFDGKLLNRTFKVSPIRPGYMRSLKFSMANGTDGSFKQGYVLITTPKRWYSDEYGTYYELTYKNNARSFNLKETFKKRAKTVTETYEEGGIPQTWSGTTDNYTSPLSGKTGITRMYTNIDLSDVRGQYLWQVKAPIPGYMHDNVTIKVSTSSGDYTGHPTSWDENSVTYQVGYWGSLNYAEITVNGDNLESKNVFTEPIQVILRDWDPWTGEPIYTDIAQGRVRNVQEDYSGTSNVSKTYNFTGTDYQVHNQNVKSLKVTTNPDGIYIPGWFINPSGTYDNVTAIYGTNSNPATKINNTTYGIGRRIKGYDSVGFQINGSNVRGFSNFKGYAFLPWTWKDRYN